MNIYLKSATHGRVYLIDKLELHSCATYTLQFTYEFKYSQTLLLVASTLFIIRITWLLSKRAAFKFSSITQSKTVITERWNWMK